MLNGLIDSLPVMGFGILLAQVAPLLDAGERMNSWPVTTILAVLVLASLGLVTFVLRNTFKNDSKVAQAIQAQAVAQTKVAAAMNELNARLNTRPCMAKEDD